MEQLDQNSIRIGFIGAGGVGKAFAWGFAAAGFPVVAAASRSLASAEQLAARIAGCRACANPQEVVDSAEIVFITVPDDAIEPLAAGLRWRAGIAAVHCSGATELSALTAAARAGADTGGFHPLQLFGDPEVALAGLPGCTVAIEAEALLLPRLERLAAALQCRTMRLPPGSRARYHAATHYAGGFIFTMMKEAADLWQSFGIGQEDAIRALSPLLRGSAASLARSGIVRGMGGIYSRGDIGTMRKHLADLSRLGSDELRLYCELALRSLALGVERGRYDAAHAERMRALLQEALQSAAAGKDGAG